MIVKLSWGTFDGGCEYYFESPPDVTLKDFKDLCDMLMREAVLNGLDGISIRFPDNNPFKHCIGYHDLVWEVAAMLPGHGYNEVKLPEVRYKHGIIINNANDDEDGVFSDELLEKITTHNNNLRMRG